MKICVKVDARCPKTDSACEKCPYWKEFHQQERRTMAEYDLTEQDVFDGMPDEDLMRLPAWAAIGQIAQRKLLKWLYARCNEHPQGKLLSHRFRCSRCMDEAYGRTIRQEEENDG